jgi:hypothetical protein
MDALDLKHEYGPVYGTRRNRWITSVRYELPTGRGRQLGSHMNPVLDGVVGAWQLATIFLVLGGPFLTPYFDGCDPSGSGSGIIGRDQALDLVGNPKLSNPTAIGWFNLGAYTRPGAAGWQPGTPASSERRAMAHHRTIRKRRNGHRSRSGNRELKRRLVEKVRHQRARQD